MPPAQRAWPKTNQVDQRGLRDSDCPIRTIRVQVTQILLNNYFDSIALLIARHSSARPRPLLAEKAITLSSSSTRAMCCKFLLNSLCESLSDFVATINRGLPLCSSHS